MTLPTSESLTPEEEPNLTPARRRRQRRNIISLAADERAEYLNGLARSLVPAFDYFLFAILAGLVLTGAILLNHPAAYLLAALLFPFLSPLMGISLAGLIGSLRYFVQALLTFIISMTVIFGCGVLAGWLSFQLPEGNFDQTLVHTVFSWVDLALVVLGAVVTAILVLRSITRRPLVSSVALAYELALPVGVAGFGLVTGADGLFPQALFTAGIYLAAAVLTGVMMLFVLGVRPARKITYLVWLIALLIAVIAYAASSGIKLDFSAALAIFPTQAATTTQLPSQTPFISTRTSTAAATTATLKAVTPTATLMPSRTATSTLAPSPTPVWGVVEAGEANGVNLRSLPDITSERVTDLLNGSLVQILPETENKNGIIWVHVRTPLGLEGWIIRSLLVTATPQS